MALGDKAREKQAKSALALLPPGTTIRAYAVGRGHARMTVGAGVVGGLFVVAFVVGLLFGVVLIPGAALLIYVFYEMRPPRGIAVSDQGTALLGRSFWSGRPSKVLALLGPLPVSAVAPTGKATLPLGDERVTVSRASFAMLAAATNATAPDPPR